MNQQIMDILDASEGRYLTKSEQTQLRDYVGQVNARLMAMEELQAKEGAIVEQTMRQVLNAYPDFPQQHLDARGKGARDLGMVLRYIAQATLRNDPQWLDTSLLVWLSTILSGLGFTPGFVEDTYKTMERAMASELTPASAELVRPFIQQCVRTLSTRPTGTSAE